MVRRSIFLILLLVAGLVLVGCIGDEDPTSDQSLQTAADPNSTDTWAKPLPETITGIEHLTQVDAVESAGGLWTEGDHAYVSGQNSGFYVLNVSTPDDPRVVGEAKDQYTRDVDMLHYDDGRQVAVAAASGSGMVFIDVTNVTQPEVVSSFLAGNGGNEANVHNVAVVPGTHLVYNSRSLDTPGIDIVDASDPTAPELVGTFGTLTCHDVTFYTPDDRAFCAGVRETQIWDVSDPESPEVVSRIYNPAIQIHHWATVTHEGSMLIIGDEFAGSTDAAAGCLAYEDTPAGPASDPVGAVWFYDISDEATPTPLGYVAPDLPANNVPPTPCTAHFGEVLPGHDKMVIGWRAAGTYLVDFSDPSRPVVVDHVTPVGDNWEAVYHNGYVFTGDTERGVDVFTFTGS